jgi:flagellar biosynthesis anti-sigma factor FlgM
MRIDNYSKFSEPMVQSTQSAKKGAAAQGTTGGNPAPAAKASGETVTVSAQAQALSREASQIDEAKVEKLRSAIQSGTFKANYQAIAKQIVDGE